MKEWVALSIGNCHQSYVYMPIYQGKGTALQAAGGASTLGNFYIFLLTGGKVGQKDGQAERWKALICKGLVERQNKKHNRLCVGKMRR